MLQQDIPETHFVITKKSYSLLDFTKKVFQYFGLNWQDYVVVDKVLDGTK